METWRPSGLIYTRVEDLFTDGDLCDVASRVNLRGTSDKHGMCQSDRLC